MVHQFTSPPPLKTVLSTVVDPFTDRATVLPLTSTLGKRRLFRHRAWAEKDSACPGWLRVKFMPGWMGKLPSGRVTYVRTMLCQEGELSAVLARVEEEHNVHLWVAPIKTPTYWPTGNRLWWGVNAHVQQLIASWSEAKAVAA